MLLVCLLFDTDTWFFGSGVIFFHAIVLCLSLSNGGGVCSNTQMVGLDAAGKTTILYKLKLGGMNIRAGTGCWAKNHLTSPLCLGVGVVVFRPEVGMNELSWWGIMWV